MCGIVGIADFSRQPEKKLVRKMLSLIQYRGPDSEGLYEHTSIAFGIRRLRIIDLETGDQPIHNEDKTITVVFNGEIYNYQELKRDLIQKGHRFYTKTDTEVIVHLYEEYGDNLADCLNGMFAFALWDLNKHQLLLVRDQVGIKPLYFYYTKNFLIFGSEIKTLLVHPQVKKEINHQSVRTYARYGYIPGSETILKNIKKLHPGTMLIFSKNSIRLKRYWKPHPKKTAGIEELLQDSITRQMMADVPVGVLLSGGIDSSLITYYLKQTRSRSIKTFSLSFPESSYNEQNYAVQIARLFSTEHYTESFAAKDVLELFPRVTALLDEPIADPSFFPTYKVSALARRYVTVALSGDGGDELFGGYPTYQAHIWADMVKFLPLKIVKLLQNLINPFSFSYANYGLLQQIVLFLDGLLIRPEHRHLYWMGYLFAGSNKWLKSDLTENKFMVPALKYLGEINLDTLNKFMYLDFQTYLRDNLLVKTDRASMYNSLEVRVPFLDPRIIEVAYAIPGSEKVDIFQTKKVLRQIAKNKLPDNIIKRKKKGFGIPLAKWLNNDLKELVHEGLKEELLYTYFDKKKVLQAWKMHQLRKVDSAKSLWSVVMLSAWIKEFYL